MRTDGLMSLAAYARYRGDRGLRGCTLNAVRRAAESGRITVVVMGRRAYVNPTQADAQWAVNTCPDRGGPKPLTVQAEPCSSGIVSGVGNGNGGAAPTYAESREVQAFYRAQREKLEYEQLIGELVPMKDFANAVSSAGIVFRRQLEGLAPRLGPELAGEADVARCRALIAEAVEAVLLATAQEFERQADRLASNPETTQSGTDP